MLSTNKDQRKERPMARGLLDYFADALAEVSHVSHVGNEQHNPGQELHWDRRKSLDHADCIVRHLADRGTIDSDGMRHSAKVAWRALALLQIELEKEAESRIDDNCFAGPLADQKKSSAATVSAVNHALLWDNDKKEFRDVGIDLAEHKQAEKLPVPLDGNQCIMLNELESYGCTRDVAMVIASGTTFPDDCCVFSGFVYIAGPMRGYPEFNFPAFDRARDEWLKKGYAVISPADIDRRAGDAEDNSTLQAKFVYRDMFSLLFLKRDANQRNSIVMLDGWERSTGARAEFMTALWLGLRMRNQRGHKIVGGVAGVSLINGVIDSLIKGG